MIVIVMDLNHLILMIHMYERIVVEITYDIIQLQHDPSFTLYKYLHLKIAKEVNEANENISFVSITGSQQYAAAPALYDTVPFLTEGVCNE